MHEATVDTRPGDARLDGHPLCSCGQELDLCRHAHCPRCGHRLTAPQPVLVG